VAIGVMSRVVIAVVVDPFVLIVCVVDLYIFINVNHIYNLKKTNIPKARAMENHCSGLFPPVRVMLEWAAKPLR